MKTANPWSEEEAIIRKIDNRRRLVGGMKQLRALPPDQRDAFLYVRVLKFTEEEAGMILGVCHQRINQLVNQGLTAIRQFSTSKK